MGAAGDVGVVSQTFAQNGFTFPSKSGAQWLDLTGTSQTATGVAQTVTTEPHTPYTISFAVGNVVNPGGIFGTTSTVDVLVDGSLGVDGNQSQGNGIDVRGLEDVLGHVRRLGEHTRRSRS